MTSSSKVTVGTDRPTGRTIAVSIETPTCALVRGYQARALITQLRGRPPVWATVSRAWVMQTADVADLLALCQTRNVEVEVTTVDGHYAPLSTTPTSRSATTADDAEERLW